MLPLSEFYSSSWSGLFQYSAPINMLGIVSGYTRGDLKTVPVVAGDSEWNGKYASRSWCSGERDVAGLDFWRWCSSQSGWNPFSKTRRNFKCQPHLYFAEGLSQFSLRYLLSHLSFLILTKPFFLIALHFHHIHMFSAFFGDKEGKLLG